MKKVSIIAAGILVVAVLFIGGSRVGSSTKIVGAARPTCQPAVTITDTVTGQPYSVTVLRAPGQTVDCIHN